MRIIGQFTVDEATLAAKYPPERRIFNSKKKAVCKKLHANLESYPYDGEILFTRVRIDKTLKKWEDDLIAKAVNDSFSSVAEQRFSYPASNEQVKHWHPNFADRKLFGFYGGNLLAQDELQVLEHPILGSLREALVDRKRITLPDGAKAFTFESSEGGETPVLVQGCQRRGLLHLDKDAEAGRPKGLYGNNFAQAELPVILESVQVLEPPVATNLYCIAAPSYGRGAYTLSQISTCLCTLYTAFKAIRELAGADAETVVHAGLWGCGAFGGNPTFSVLVQLVAASLSGITRIQFHGIDGRVTKAFEEAQQALKSHPTLSKAKTWSQVMHGIESLKLEWGLSDST